MIYHLWSVKLQVSADSTVIQFTVALWKGLLLSEYITLHVSLFLKQPHVLLVGFTETFQWACEQTECVVVIFNDGMLLTVEATRGVETFLVYSP